MVALDFMVFAGMVFTIAVTSVPQDRMIGLITIEVCTMMMLIMELFVIKFWPMVIGNGTFCWNQDRIFTRRS